MYKKIKGIYSESEVITMINELVNAQDKFIIMALFNGISGEDMIELRELKTSDVDFEKNTINLPDRVVNMDAKFAKITKEAIEQKIYLNNISDSIYASEDSEFNMDSEYILKTKPTTRNNFGTKAMAYEAFRGRIRKLKLPIPPKDIIDSGMIYRLLDIQPIYTVAEVEATLRQLGYKKSAFRVYSLINKINGSKYINEVVE